MIRQCFILAFVHIYTRKVWLTPCAFKPDAAWMKEQADAFLAHAKSQDLPVEVVLRDRDSKYTAAASVRPFHRMRRSRLRRVSYHAVQTPKPRAALPAPP